MKRTPPSRLYKYQPLSAQTLAALKVRTLWFGRPDALNDPFDCAVPWRLRQVTAEDCLRLLEARAGTKWERLKSDSRYMDSAGQPTAEFIASVQRSGQASFEQFAREAYAEMGVSCFSETPLSLLLWAHYGASHRGICLEFDTSSPLLDRLHPVTYSDDLPELDVVDVLMGNRAHILSLLLTKAACWSYEQEWRALHRQANTVYCYGVEALTGVFLGAALSEAEKDLVCHVLHGTPTKIHVVARARDAFRLIASPVTYAPYVHTPPDVV